MIKIFTVDAFTDVPFKGNPAAVCLPEKKIEDKLMQKIAFEMNLSETAFVYKLENGFSLRWFTPKSEVELCGHATLASAHILWQEKILKSGEEAVFHSVYKGILKASQDENGITLDFPANNPQLTQDVPGIDEALGVEYVNIYTTEHHYLVELKSEEDLKRVHPDIDLLKALPKYGTILTCKSQNKRFDFISRFFAPAKGIYEDPVTGSAHCTLAPYWSAKLNKKTLKAFQASERGGILTLAVNNDRVLISGKAFTVLSGILNF